MSGDADSQAAGLVGVLARSREFGFLGPGPLEQQIDHSQAFAALIEEFRGGAPQQFLDLGAGGGLPGLVLLERWPGASAVLVDAQEKRCRFLLEAIAELGWERRVEVRTGRAEILAREPALRGRFDLVVARGFGPPPVTAECAVGFLQAGGILGVTEPPEVGAIQDPESRWSVAGLASLGFDPAVLLRNDSAGAAFLNLPLGADERWPRRDGVPGKRPLW